MPAGPVRAHFFEQYFTFGQSRSHFLRHSNGRPQQTQIFAGLGGLPISNFSEHLTCHERSRRDRKNFTPAYLAGFSEMGSKVEAGPGDVANGSEVGTTGTCTSPYFQNQGTNGPL